METRHYRKLALFLRALVNHTWHSELNHQLDRTAQAVGQKSAFGDSKPVLWPTSGLPTNGESGWLGGGVGKACLMELSSLAGHA